VSRFHYPHRLLAVATAGIALFGLSACSAITGQSASTSAPSGEVRSILFDHPYSSLPVWGVVVGYAQERADQLGVTLEVTKDDANLTTQVSNLEAYLAKGVDAVVSLPMDNAGVQSIADRFRTNDTTWVTYGSELEKQDGSLQFSFQESGRLLGEGAGNWALKNLGGKGKALILEEKMTQIGSERTAGILAGLEATAPGVEIVAQQQAFTPDEALSVTTSVLAQHPDVNMVIAVTSDGAQGAYQALLQSGRAEDDARTWVGGVDTNTFLLRQIAAGTFARGIVTYDPRDLGYAVIDLPIAIANGTAEDPTHDVPVELVTADDVERLQELLSSSK
jgi:ribose transport system substrate-binding protein